MYAVSWLITPTETAEGVVQVFEQVRMKEGVLAPLIHTDRGAAYGTVPCQVDTLNNKN